MPWLEALQGYDLLRSTRTAGWSGVIIDEVRAQDSENFLAGSNAHLIGLTLSGNYGFNARVEAKQYAGDAQTGTLSFVPAGLPSFWRHSGLAARKAIVWIPERLVTEARDEMSIRTAGSPDLRPLFNTRNGTVENFIKMVMGELRRPSHPAQNLIFDGASLALTAEIIRHFGPPVAHGRSATGRLSRRHLAAVTRYIDEHPYDRITLAELAALAQVGRSHFVRLFRNTVGSSPMAYVEQSRIARATELLHSKELSISEVATATGFADQSHFTRRFRARIGVTPAAYQRAILGK